MLQVIGGLGSTTCLLSKTQFFIANVGIHCMTIKKACYRVRRAWGGRCLLIESERFQHALQGVRVTQFTSDLSFEGHRTRKRERERERGMITSL